MDRGQLGEGLLRAIEVMAALRGPHGCPWDKEQTHASLVRYAIEESHEVADAVARSAWDELPEELGDLLLQVLFHAQIASEEGTFDIDDVAAALVDKLTRRHPHVFGGDAVENAAEVEARWEEIKRSERGAEEHPLANKLARLPRGLPALARAHAVLTAIERMGGDTAALIGEASHAVGGETAKVGDAVGKLWRAGGELEVDTLKWVAALEEAAISAESKSHTNRASKQ